MFAERMKLLTNAMPRKAHSERPDHVSCLVLISTQMSERRREMLETATMDGAAHAQADCLHGTFPLCEFPFKEFGLVLSFFWTFPARSCMGESGVIIIGNNYFPGRRNHGNARPPTGTD